MAYWEGAAFFHTKLHTLYCGMKPVIALAIAGALSWWAQTLPHTQPSLTLTTSMTATLPHSPPLSSNKSHRCTRGEGMSGLVALFLVGRVQAIVHIHFLSPKWLRSLVANSQPHPVTFSPFFYTPSESRPRCCYDAAYLADNW